MAVQWASNRLNSNFTALNLNTTCSFTNTKLPYCNYLKGNGHVHVIGGGGWGWRQKFLKEGEGGGSKNHIFPFKMKNFAEKWKILAEQGEGGSAFEPWM